MRAAENSTVPDEPTSGRPPAHDFEAHVTDAQVAGPTEAEESAVTDAQVALPTAALPTVTDAQVALPTAALPTAAETDADAGEDTGPDEEFFALADSSTQDPGLDDPLGREIVARYAPAVAFYRLCEDRLRKTASAGPGGPIGWTPHLQALRALRDGDVTGRWEDLARLMLDPGALAAGTGRPECDRPEGDRLALARAAVDTPHALLLQAPSGAERSALIAEIVKRLAAEGARTLLMAPATATAGAVLESLGDEHEIFAVQAVPAGPGTGTGPGASEGRPYAATIRTGGTAHLRAWKAELRRLQRELMWLEQWPRDWAALTALRAEQQRRGDEWAARTADCEAEIGEYRGVVTTAGQAATTAREEHDRRSADHRRAADEATVLRAEYAVLQAASDTAAQAADERGRAVAQCRAHRTALEERTVAGRQELQAARDREQSLTEELARAKESLPETAAEAERLYVAEADAAADGHMTYYRLAAAESALAAQKRGTSLGQRIRPTPERQELRRQVSALKRESDEAAIRARRAREALDRAEARHAQVAAFVANGGTELLALRDAQERLAEEIVRLTAEIETLRSSLDELLRIAAEAAEQATGAAAAARHARHACLLGEERLTEARLAQERAAAARDQAQKEERTAARRLTAAEERLELLREQAAARIAQDRAELRMMVESELGSRGHVREICGTDPSIAADGVLRGHRDRAMARIERLSGYLELAQDPMPAGEVTAELAELLLSTSVLACGAPLDVAAGPLARMDGFDMLIADDADRLTDGEFLIGAVRARRWILVGDRDRRPERAGDHENDDHLHALAALHLTRQPAGHLAERPGEDAAGGDTDTDDHDRTRTDTGGQDGLDTALETVAARWGEDEPNRMARLPQARAEAERIWGRRHGDANSYQRALRRSRPVGGTDEDAERRLIDVARPTLFRRCAAAGLALRLASPQEPTRPED